MANINVECCLCHKHFDIDLAFPQAMGF